MTVTGFDGYLGPHTVLEFVKNGNFNVRATIREGTDDAKLAPVKAAFGEHFDKVEIVKAELLDEASMAKAIEGSTYVAHLASPYYLDNKTREELT